MTSIPIPDEPDMSWASLGVIHELHCLSRLRMSIWTDHYYADFSDEERELNRAHSDHCLDYLRQAAMCHGDVSLTTYRWTDDSPLPVADFASPKVCVNWDALADWQRERLWDPLVPGLLKHPKFGTYDIEHAFPGAVTVTRPLFFCCILVFFLCKNLLLKTEKRYRGCIPRWER